MPLKKMLTGMFKVCPKSGRVVGMRKSAWWLFPIAGIAATLWFVIRVFPKPSRSLYPCQQISLSVSASFFAWLAGIAGSTVFFRKSRKLFKEQRTLLAMDSLLVGVGIILMSQLFISSPSQAYLPTDTVSNSPKGVAKGIYPGRVTWIRDTLATPWNGTTGRWWKDTTGINQVRVDSMISRSIRALTGAVTDSAAWSKVFLYYNSTHGRGNVGYSDTESIAVKINLNNCTTYGDTDQNADASKQTVLTTLRQLVYNAKVPQNKITVYDAIRAIPNRIYNPCHTEFPNVIWVDNIGTTGRTLNVWSSTGAFTYSKTNAGNTIIPACVVKAKYIVNLPLMKGHEYSGITLCAKNHYGSLNARDHSNYLKVYLATMPQYSMLVDILGSKQLGGKDLIYIVDALYANYTNTQDNNKDRCGFSLFGGQWCASIFMSLDPIAMESVGLDFLYSEFGAVLGRRTRPATTTTPSINSNNYLFEASQANSPPSGTVYKPDGTVLTSLGVYEHWNNATSKQYSRNLGTGLGIELYSVPVSGAVVNTIPRVPYSKKFAASGMSYSNGILRYTIPQDMGDGKLVIANMQGRAVATERLTPGTHEQRLAHSGIASGAYVVSLYAGTSSLVEQQTITISR